MGSLGITQVLCHSQLTDMNDTMCHTNCNEILLFFVINDAFLKQVMLSTEYDSVGT
jgi:hypothetical protein